MIIAAIHGFILAFGLILPLGVQNVFVFNQGALHKRFRGALPAVLTASICDTLLILLSVLGVSLVVLHSAAIKITLMTAGVLFLLFMGWTTWRQPARASGRESRAESFSRSRQIVFAASVSLLNPHAILDTVGVIGTSSLQYEGWDKAAFALACILVSWFWFLSLSLLGRTTGRIDPAGRMLTVINKLSALFMWGVALYIAISLLGSLF